MVQLAESLIIAKPILEIIKQAWGEEWFSFLKLTQSNAYSDMSWNPVEERDFNF